MKSIAKRLVKAGHPDLARQITHPESKGTAVRGDTKHDDNQFKIHLKKMNDSFIDLAVLNEERVEAFENSDDDAAHDERAYRLAKEEEKHLDALGMALHNLGKLSKKYRTGK